MHDAWRDLSWGMVGVEDDPISMSLVPENGMMSAALQCPRGLQNRVVLRFGPGTQGVIRRGVSYAVVGAFVAVGGIRQVVCAFVPDDKRPLVY